MADNKDFAEKTNGTDDTALHEMIEQYVALTGHDLPFIKQCLTSTNINTKSHIQTIVKTLLNGSSFALFFPNSEAKFSVKIGLLVWYCVIANSQAARSFHIYLQALYDQLDEDEAEQFEKAMFAWETSSLDQFKIYIPNSYQSYQLTAELAINEPITTQQWSELKTRSQPFLEFLKQEEEEEEDEDEEEDEN